MDVDLQPEEAAGPTNCWELFAMGSWGKVRGKRQRWAQWYQYDHCPNTGNGVIDVQRGEVMDSDHRAPKWKFCECDSPEVKTRHLTRLPRELWRSNQTLILTRQICPLGLRIGSNVLPIAPHLGLQHSSRSPAEVSVMSPK